MDQVEQVDIWLHRGGDEICNRADHAAIYQHSVVRVAVASRDGDSPHDAVVMCIPLADDRVNGLMIRLEAEATMNLAYRLIAAAWQVHVHG